MNQRLQPERRPPLRGAAAVEAASDQVEDARPNLIKAMGSLDCPEHRDLHMRVGRLVLELDDLRSILAERSAR